jgi:hypothetical protein
MNSRVLFLIVGLVLGAIVGYLTRPTAAEISFGPLHVEVQGDHAAGVRDEGGLTNGQIKHIAIYTVAGGVLGALAGLLAARRA